MGGGVPNITICFPLFVKICCSATGLDPLMILAELKGKEKKKKRGYDSIRGHSEKGQKIEAPDEEIGMFLIRLQIF